PGEGEVSRRGGSFRQGWKTPDRRKLVSSEGRLRALHGMPIAKEREMKATAKLLTVVALAWGALVVTDVEAQRQGGGGSGRSGGGSSGSHHGGGSWGGASAGGWHGGSHGGGSHGGGHYYGGHYGHGHYYYGGG